MDWKHIKSKYPEAYYKYGVWADNEMILDYFAPDINKVNLRHLYDFFDENEIYISILHRDSLKTIPPYQWKIRGDISEGYHSRSLAEEVAFTKAFEILEEKL